jgi:hypothetical protein
MTREAGRENIAPLGNNRSRYVFKTTAIGQPATSPGRTSRQTPPESRFQAGESSACYFVTIAFDKGVPSCVGEQNSHRGKRWPPSRSIRRWQVVESFNSGHVRLALSQGSIT